MKKILTITLAFFYLALASGVLINSHYCGGNLKKIALYSSTDEDGCCGTEEESDGCCKNKSSFFKVKDDHNTTGSIKIAGNFFKFFAVNQPDFKITIKPAKALFPEAYYDPPILYEHSLYLKNRVLLI